MLVSEVVESIDQLAYLQINVSPDGLISVWISIRILEDLIDFFKLASHVM